MVDLELEPSTDLRPNQPAVSVRNLSVTYPGDNGGLQALKDISFNVYPQDFVCLLGPSGSGKSTLLRVLAELVEPTSGEVLFQRPAHPAGVETGGMPPRISLVFQDANLMPWRTVHENISLPLELQGVPDAEIRKRVQEWIHLIGLKGFEGAWPADLSGGMAQRVAIARSLIQNPDLLLLDEPFGSLDALTRDKMSAELLNLWQAHRPTVLMVTHSISEALLLSDRVIVLTPRPGRIELDLKVDLPRPRQEEVRFTEAFGELARTLRAAIR